MEPSPQSFLDVLCVGHAAFDLTLTVDHHPEADEKCSASSLTACGGGPAANAAVAVARLGGNSALAAYLGEDLHGGLHMDELRGEGVDTSLVVRGPHPTPLSIILVKPDGKRTVINHKASTPHLRRDDVDFSRCLPRVILFDGHEPLISLPQAQSAREKRIITILDAGSVHRGTSELLPLVTCLVASEKFALEFTGEQDATRALNGLQGTAPCVVITLGEKGLVWKRGKDQGALPAFAVDALDTTGAGDTFHGAFSLGMARGFAFLHTLKYASAAAALSCTKLGSRLGIPGKQDVDEFLQSFATY